MRPIEVSGRTYRVLIALAPVAGLLSMVAAYGLAWAVRRFG